MNGAEVAYRYIGKQYLQVITPIQDKNNDKSDVRGLIIAMVSLQNCNEMSEYLHDQRDNLVGIFFIITLIFSVLVALLIRNNFRRMQNELDIIAAGHQEEGLGQENFREFYNLSSSFNKIINRYKELENTRQEFVSNVSHELKTPITSMKILADSLLMQPDVPVELYEEFMNDIVHEIDRENQIITDLLTLVKMDKTQADLNITSVKINDLLEVLLKRISPIAEKRGIKIRLETMREVVAEVDEVKLSLACNNLIENAVKYNHDDGKVDVSLNADHKFFYIRVKDTGCGIPEDCQEQIFERFYRVDKARSRETGGTGLGLAITRNVVLMHKGSIRVHSKEGEGATFIIRIPLNYISQEADAIIKRISYVIFLVSLLTLTVLCGCDKSTKSAQEKQEKTENQEQVTKEETDRKKNNTINLYYLNAQEDGFKKVSCKLQHSDDLKEMANEVLYKLSDTENNNTNKYKASIFDGVVINDVNVIRGKATIDFGAGYIQLSHTQEVLLRTSVVKSLLQIQGIDGVLFSVNGSSLLDNDKMPVGLMEASTILTDDGQADIYSAKKKVKIYYTNEQEPS